MIFMTIIHAGEIYVGFLLVKQINVWKKRTKNNNNLYY